MHVKQATGRLVLRAMRYRMEGGPPPTDLACVLVAAPHTSWLDFPLMMSIAWAHELTPLFLAKQEMFRAPFGGLMRRLGGIPVDRDDPGNLVADLVARSRSGESFSLAIAPEGTRGRGTHWKSGFYRIALDAGLPLVLTYIDGPTRSGGFGPTIALSGDVHADMDLVRAFYADKHGVVPANWTPPLLREEDLEQGDRPAP